MGRYISYKNTLPTFKGKNIPFQTFIQSCLPCIRDNHQHQNSFHIVFECTNSLLNLLEVICANLDFQCFQNMIYSACVSTILYQKVIHNKSGVTLWLEMPLTRTCQTRLQCTNCKPHQKYSRKTVKKSYSSSQVLYHK